jgi:mannose-6-phosphate isomerase-like protein (cupin superfamily)
MADPVFTLSTHPVHLDAGTGIVRLERFDGTPEWYERYGAAHLSTSDDGRLVTMHSFDRSWDTWEMHPRGDELVVCVQGTIVLHQEIGGEVTTVELATGQAVVNPPGAWHTADVTGACTALFVTAGAGTEIRPR